MLNIRRSRISTHLITMRMIVQNVVVNVPYQLFAVDLVLNFN